MPVTNNNSVQVFVRIRPTAEFATDQLELANDGKSLVALAKKAEDRGYINNQILTWNFSFDGVLHNAGQGEVYRACASNLVTQCLDGYNCTIFAYGQTGGGKTYTMTGNTNDFKQRGIIPRALSQLYREIKQRHESAISVQISYLEIYKEQVFDLLATYTNEEYSDQVTVTEDAQGNAYVKGLSYHSAETEEQALSLLFEGEANRLIGCHQLNPRSSRSHCIFTVYIESHSTTEDNAHYTVSKLNLVDLAGSERLRKTKSEGLAHEEATYINKSLTFLEQTVIALAERKRDHIPYRQSKLTHILKDAVGGQCQTVMIGNIWGEAEQMEETLSTLRFANRVRNIPNEPAVNFFTNSVKQCKRLEREIVALKQELAMYDTLTNRGQVNYEPLSQAQIDDIKKQIQRFVDGETQEIEIINIRQVKEVFEQFKQMLKVMKIEKEQKQHETPVVPQQTEKKDSAVRGRGVRVKSGLITTQEDVPLVGETDGQGFGVGLAPPSAKPGQTTSIVAARKTKSRRGKGETVHSADRKESSPQQVNQSGQHGTDTKVSAAQNIAHPTTGTQPSAQQAKELQQISSQPSKDEAFEMFKKERGLELNKILTDNKEILKGKIMEVKSSVAIINELKEGIDKTKSDLATIQEKSLRQGERVTTEGKPVISEEEFLLLRKQKDLKLKYRTAYEDLNNTRSDVEYCEKLVDQCRKRLLQEFEAWFVDCFGSPEKSQIVQNQDGKEGNFEREKAPAIRQGNENVSASVQVETRDYSEDEEERFQRLQMEILMREPESVPFYNAKMMSERRHLLRGNGTRRPGSVTSQIRNKPPTSLLVN